MPTSRNGLQPHDISQAEFIRQAITGASHTPHQVPSPPSMTSVPAAVGKLTAEYGEIGGNLNHIARAAQRVRNSPLSARLSGEVRAAVSDLAALKFESLAERWADAGLATFKHISSKNADYGAAEQYLTFEHDEFTMKPTLDEAGG